MALSKKVVSAVLAKGLDQSKDPKLTSDELLRLENAICTYRGEFRKRCGLTALSGSYSDQNLAEHKGKPVLFGSEVRVLEGTTLTKIGDLNLMDVEPKDIGVPSGYDVYACEAAENGDVIAIAWTAWDPRDSSYGYMLATYNRHTWRQIDSTTGGYDIKVFATANGFVYVTATGAPLKMSYGTIDTAGAINKTPTQVGAQTSGAHDAVLLNPTGPVFAIGHTRSDAQLEVIIHDGSDYVNPTGVSAVVLMGVYRQAADEVVILWEDGTYASGTLKARGWKTGGASGGVGTIYSWATDTWIVSATGVATSATVGTVYVGLITTALATDEIKDGRIRKNTFTPSTGAAGSDSLFLSGCYPLSKPFIDADDATKHYMVVHQQGKNDGINRATLIVRQDATYFARLLPGATDLVGLLWTRIGNVCDRGSNQWTFAAMKRTGQQTAAVTVCRAQKNQSGVKAVSSRDSLLIPCAAPWEVDGQQVHEQGFWNFPRELTVSRADSGSPTPIGVGAYGYVAIYRWYDARGIRHESAPSLVAEITTTGANDEVTIKIPTLKNTHKTTASIVLYRTEVNKAVYYWLTELQNNANVEEVTHVDDASDGSISTNEAVYSMGGVLEHAAPAPYRVSCIHQDRQFYVARDNEDWDIRYSNRFIDGEGIAHNEVLTASCDPSGGAIVALSSFMDKLIIWKGSRVLACDGYGLSLTGTGRGYSDPYLIVEGIGCVNAKTIVQTPMGLLFEAADGLYVLTPTLQVQPIGEPIADTYRNVTVKSGCLIPDLHYVLFSTDDVALVFDYKRGLWSTFTGHAADDAVAADGLLYLKAASGTTVYKEDRTSHQDAGSAIALKIRTGWYSFAGLQGFARLYKTLLLGQNISPHKLTVRTAYNFDPSWVSPDQTYETSDHTETKVWSEDTVSTVDQFGQSVSVDGEWAVVGAPYQKVGGVTAVGAIFIYRRTGKDSWAFHQRIDGSGAISSHFGGAVSISGSRIAVMERKTGAAAGTQKIYFYTKDSDDVWAIDATQTITEPTGYIWQDHGQALELDGNDLVVATTLNATSEIGAHVYTYVSSWTSQGFSTTGLTTGSNVAAAVDSTNNRMLLGVSTYDSSKGRVWTFTRSGAVWSAEQTIDPPSPVASGYFGCAVSLAGTFCAIGAYGEASTKGQAHVFLKGTTWALQKTLVGEASGDDFGMSVCLVGDYLAVGAKDGGANNGGNGYLYHRSGTDWALAATFACQGSAQSSSQDYGMSIALEGDTVVVGGPGSVVGSPQGAVCFETLAAMCFDTPAHFGDGLDAGFQHKAYMLRLGTNRGRKLTSVMLEITDSALTGSSLFEGFALSGVSFLVGIKTGLWRPGEARRI